MNENMCDIGPETANSVSRKELVALVLFLAVGLFGGCHADSRTPMENWNSSVSETASTQQNGIELSPWVAVLQQKIAKFEWAEDVGLAQQRSGRWWFVVVDTIPVGFKGTFDFTPSEVPADLMEQWRTRSEPGFLFIGVDGERAILISNAKLPISHVLPMANWTIARRFYLDRGYSGHYRFSIDLTAGGESFTASKMKKVIRRLKNVAPPRHKDLDIGGISFDGSSIAIVSGCNKGKMETQIGINMSGAEAGVSGDSFCQRVLGLSNRALEIAILGDAYFKNGRFFVPEYLREAEKVPD